MNTEIIRILALIFAIIISTLLALYHVRDYLWVEINEPTSSEKVKDFYKSYSPPSPSKDRPQYVTIECPEDCKDYLIKSFENKEWYLTRIKPKDLFTPNPILTFEYPKGTYLKTKKNTNYYHNTLNS